jgi:hypothetical protein
MDDEGAAVRRIAGVVGAAVIAVLCSAHIGSPDVFFDGKAGPYDVRVIIRPPMVVPGLAEVIVRAPNADVSRVIIRPVFWRAGSAGAPEGDVATRVPGQTTTYSGQLWLMARGAYSVYVTVDGARGSGTAIVPVNSFATGRLGLSRGLGAILVVLGVALFAGLVTIVRAASGDSLLAPGEAASPAQRRRANAIALTSVPVLALALFGGAAWWEAVDRDYQRTMYRAPALDVAARLEQGGQVLDLAIMDTSAFRLALASVVPDHGKMMHLFLVNDAGSGSFAHVHPIQQDSASYRATLPGLPAGNYRVFADITTGTGATFTLATTIVLPAAPPRAAADSDDAWTASARAVRIAPNAAADVGDGLTIGWSGSSAPLVAKHEIDLRFTVRDARGAVVALDPYLGMAAHAVVMRDDGTVFIHLHPMGTVSAASQQLFMARDRGDTTASGGMLPEMMPAAMPMSAMSMVGELSFPYEFPRSGHYRVWVQVKKDGHIRTATFDADVN